MTRSQRIREQGNRHRLYSALASIVVIHAMLGLIYCIHSNLGGWPVMAALFVACLAAFVAWVEGVEASRLARIADRDPRYKTDPAREAGRIHTSPIT